MASKTLSVIKKNFLILLNSKLSSIILIFGPILLILILGLGIGGASGVRSIDVNVYAEEKSSGFTDLLIEELRSRSYKVEQVYYLENCIEGVRKGDKNVCIEINRVYPLFPVQTDVGYRNLTSADLGMGITMHLDFSKQRTVWGIVNQIEAAVSDLADKVRGGAGNGLKERFEEQLALARKAEITIAFIDDSITTVIENLNSINTNVPGIGDLSELEQDLLNLASVISSLENPELNSDVNSVINTLNKIESNQEEIKKIVQEDTTKAKEELEEFSEDVDTMRSQISELRTDLEDFEEFNLGYITNPIPSTYASVSGKVTETEKDTLGLIDYLFPSFISFFILLMSIIFTSTMIIKERESSAHVRNMTAKVKPLIFIIGTYVTILIVILLQVGIILTISEFFLNLSILQNIFKILIASAVAISVFAAIGMIIGYLFGSQEIATIVAILVSLIFLIFSPLISPLETLSPSLSLFFSYTPLIIIDEIFRKIIIFEDLGLNVKNLAVLFSIFLVSIILAIFTSRFTRDKEIK